VWRRNVTNIDHTDNYALFSEFYGSFRKPKTLADTKHIADTLISLLDEEKALLFGLSMLGVPAEEHGEIVQRWAAAGKLPRRASGVSQKRPLRVTSKPATLKG